MVQIWEENFRNQFLKRFGWGHVWVCSAIEKLCSHSRFLDTSEMLDAFVCRFNPWSEGSDEGNGDIAYLGSIMWKNG